jgi:hypothetical protein
MKRKELIANPYFLIGLFILMLNDLYLKYEYGNWITGKLSDFIGLLIFPMFIVSLFPKLKYSASIITGIIFILWKSPPSTPAIELINRLSFIPIHRVIDYSDLWALLILPISHYLINYYKNLPALKLSQVTSLSRIALLGVAFFAFCSTSVLWRETPQGTIFIGESYNIKLSKDSIISTIKGLGYNCEYHDSITQSPPNQYYDGVVREYYQTDNIIRYWDNTTIRDTIANVKYTLTAIKPNKTKLTLLNVTLSEEGNVQNWKVLKDLSKQYNHWLKNNLIEKID